MSTFNRPLTGVLLAGAAAAFVATHPAAAQQRLYRVLDLGELAGGPPSRPFGINNDGAVVGQGNAGTELHAFIWLPRLLYGFDCGLNDLHDLPAVTPDGNSIAYDVNKTFFTGQAIYEAAQIVGQAGFTGDPDDNPDCNATGDAFVWTIFNGTATTTDLSTFSGGLCTTTAARGINDAKPAVVVGDGVRGVLNCQETPVDVTAGFRTTLDGSGLLELLNPLADDNASFGRDVNTPPLPPPGQPAVPLTAVGYSEDEFPTLRMYRPIGLRCGA